MSCSFIHLLSQNGKLNGGCSETHHPYILNSAIPLLRWKLFLIYSLGWELRVYFQGLLLVRLTTTFRILQIKELIWRFLAIIYCYSSPHNSQTTDCALAGVALSLLAHQTHYMRKSEQSHLYSMPGATSSLPASSDCQLTSEWFNSRATLKNLRLRMTFRTSYLRLKFQIAELEEKQKVYLQLLFLVVSFLKIKI